jgi:hypothetical protein
LLNHLQIAAPTPRITLFAIRRHGRGGISTSGGGAPALVRWPPTDPAPFNSPPSSTTPTHAACAVDGRKRIRHPRIRRRAPGRKQSSGPSAWERLRSRQRVTFHEWLAVGRAIIIGRTEALKSANTNRASAGRRPSVVLLGQNLIRRHQVFGWSLRVRFQPTPRAIALPPSSPVTSKSTIVSLRTFIIIAACSAPVLSQ